MKSYQHSVLLDESKCEGCTTCVQHCPTEAIRVRDGHAMIINDRCIDCGECIRRCPHKAKKAVVGSLDDMKKFPYKIALPAPSLYGQFQDVTDIDDILNGLLKIGFDSVYEVAKAAEIVTNYTRRYLEMEGLQKPVLSTACPVIIRLVSLMYPSLKEHLLPLQPPIQIAAKLAREKARKEHPELKPEEIGIVFISPCPAKASYISNFTDGSTGVDLVVSISEVYFELHHAFHNLSEAVPMTETGMIGVGWAGSGGEAAAIMNEDYLAADGIENVIRVLNQIDNGNITKVKFVELNACPGGCVGGVLNIQNPFIARAKLQSLRKYLPVSMNHLPKADTEIIPEDYIIEKFPEHHPLSKLSDSLSESMRMMSEIQKLRASLPGLDCGACGAPNCTAYCEDFVRGKIRELDCPIVKARRKDC